MSEIDDVRRLLARTNLRLAELRRWLAHDHRDGTWWDARGTTARQAQKDRAQLRQLANLLHVERATTRGRVHGTWFATLAEQRAWLDGMSERTCRRVAELMGLPADATLAALRAGAIAL
jgi:hypothetical protein